MTNATIIRPRPYVPGLSRPTAGAEERQRRKKILRAIHFSDEFFQLVEEEFAFLLNEIEDKEPELRALVLRGPTGAGKSHFLSKLRKNDRLVARTDEYGEIRPLQYVLAPSPSNLATLGAEIHYAITGRPISARASTADIWVRARTALYSMGVRVLMLDEMQRAFLGQNKDEMAKLMGTLACLLQGTEDPELVESIGRVPDTVVKFPIALVMAGMPWLKDVIATDGQLIERCAFVNFEPFGHTEVDEKAMKSFLDRYARRIEFEKLPEFSTPDMMLRFRKATNSYRGRMARLIKRAAIRAINRGETDPDWRALLAEAFERTYEVGDARNPFIVANVKKLGSIKEIEMDESTRLKGKGLSLEGLGDDD